MTTTLTPADVTRYLVDRGYDPAEHAASGACVTAGFVAVAGLPGDVRVTYRTPPAMELAAVERAAMTGVIAAALDLSPWVVTRQATPTGGQILHVRRVDGAR